MNSWTFNKIAGAVLGTALFVFGLEAITGVIYHRNSASAEKPGMTIEVAETAAPAEGGGEAPAEAKSIGALLATADATKGAAEAKACAACHDFAKGGPNKTGPGLWDVVERPIGKHEGYAYSPAFVEKSSETWTYEHLNAFLASPKGFISGTKMAFGGIKNDTKRANLIAYLATLSDAPKPFPAP
ncbi:MAG: cytochrome c family protein [Rhizobiales bacterium]|nr:cytochrome c family protein [Hyphomicrobiales bacterium]